MIVQLMQSSDDPVLRECGEYEAATEVVAGLAWQFFKREWHQVGGHGGERGGGWMGEAAQVVAGL